jgi:hypothetical protein
MKKIIRLTESDLARIVRRVIREEEEGMSGTVPGCKDTRSAMGQNLGCVTNRKPYYDMMKKGQKPNVLLTYKLDGGWFDNHTYTSMFDMATPGMGVSDKDLAYMLYVVRQGNFGVNPSQPNATFKLGQDERQKADDSYKINAQLEKVFKGSASPR